MSIPGRFDDLLALVQNIDIYRPSFGNEPALLILRRLSGNPRSGERLIQIRRNILCRFNPH